jgi:hypothetical protein
MKKLWVLLTAFTLMSARCKKDTIEINRLPPITQTGANTFGAVVNGKVFLPKVNFGNYTPKLDVSYDTFVTQRFYIVTNNTDTHTSFSFTFDHIDLKTGNTFQLVDFQPDKTNAAMVFYNGPNKQAGADYHITPPLTGTLQVLKFDPVQKIFSGTFSYEAINSLGEKVSVTNGRFDLKFL